jgi:hypothetical protein
MEWKVVERPGYFGTSRNEIHARYDKQFGNNNWRIAWEWGKQIIQKSEALQIYEDGYYEFFKLNKDVLDRLITTASDVYDSAPSNIEARFNYDVQETKNNHIHDVAIRRAVLRNGVWFRGDHLMHVRPEKEGEKLGPHLIPFHLPDMIFRGQIKYKGEDRDFSNDPPWWIKMGIENSVEQFYQQNKVLEIKET